ncbi:uncharacterized protein si:dkey-229e3.2 [Triplophysa dalaica]|uniref:uncharacterized protein si:dkey-229e3.2 n=1 Tax=Triplophysa dalaica TaxID=1582913 RepID=UPI0024DF7749|nr:uncharacterized protein si:dkey-229e3.2 [Triplophysa dalaica]
MGDCMLDSYDEDGFQSSEGFDDWATFSSADWAEPQQDDNSFSDWGVFHDNTEKEEEFSSMPVEESGTAKIPEKIENGKQVNVQFAFRDCFRVDGAEKEPLTLEIPTLFQLLQIKTDLPSPSSAISGEAANLWCHLHSKSEILRLSSPKPKLHSSEQLLKTLELRHPDASTASQSTILSGLDLEEPEDRRGTLIQTKLMPPSQCRNGSGFFYQISRKWLSQHSMNMFPHQWQKDPLQ